MNCLHPVPMKNKSPIFILPYLLSSMQVFQTLLYHRFLCLQNYFIIPQCISHLKKQLFVSHPFPNVIICDSIWKLCIPEVSLIVKKKKKKRALGKYSAILSTLELNIHKFVRTFHFSTGCLFHI